MMKIVDETSAIDGIDATCDALGVCRSTYYRSRQPRVYGPRYQMRCPRSLLPAERQEVLTSFMTIDSVTSRPHRSTPRYSTKIATFAWSAMYRVLTANDEVRERRAQLMHPRYEAPELLATKPDQLWSWGTSRLADLIASPRVSDDMS